MCCAFNLMHDWRAMSRFVWHQYIRVTHCQSSAMSFIVTQYFFCNSFRHGLIQRIIIKTIYMNIYKEVLMLYILGHYRLILAFALLHQYQSTWMTFLLVPYTSIFYDCLVAMLHKIWEVVKCVGSVKRWL